MNPDDSMAEPPPPPPPPPPISDAAPSPPASNDVPSPRRGNRRWLVVVAIVAAVAVIAAGTTVGVLALRHSNAPAPHPATTLSQPHRTTVPEAIMARGADENGVLDFEGALELFSYAFAPLPGVTLPTGAADQPGHWTSMAGAQIAAHLGELTPAQLAVVLPYFRDISGGGGSIAQIKASSWGGVGPVLAGASVQPGAYVRQDIANLVAKAFAEEAARLGHTIADFPALTSFQHVWLYLTSKADVPGAAAWTVGSAGPGFDSSGNLLSTFNDVGKITDCSIFVPPSLWGSESGGHWIASEDDLQSIYHEVFHCYQDFVLGSVTGAVPSSTPQWVIEGGATWAEGSILSVNLFWWETGAEGFDDGYLPTPRTPLSWRSYSGFGLLFEIEHLGRPLWPVWWGLWSAAAQGGLSSTADWFKQLAGTRYATLLDSWASSFYLKAPKGWDWTTGGTGQHPDQGTAPEPFAGKTLTLLTQPFATYEVAISPQKADTVVETAATEPNIRFSDASNHEDVGVGVAFLCWAAQCQPNCPGSSAQSPLTPIHVKGLVSWAYTSTKAGSATITALTKQQYCQLKLQHPSPPKPCLELCADSNGDPHMKTVDGRHYEFQAAGEFVLLRSSDGSTEIQARQEPVPGSTITINTAVAVRMGTHRAGIYLGSGAQPFEVHVDGHPVTLTSPMSVGGGTIVPHSLGVEFDLPDGTVVWAVVYTAATSTRYGIITEILPSDSLRTGGVGLLGPEPLGYVLPLLPDGTGRRVSADPTAQYDFEYHTFAPAWRVTDATTLFDYAPGKNTESYTLPGFIPLGGPPKIASFDAITALPPVARAAAETSCAGVNDEELRNQCVYDVTATGDTGFVQSYTAAEGFLATATGSTTGGSAPAPSSGPTIKPLITGFNGIDGFAIGPDGALDIVVAMPSGAEILAVDPSTTTIRTEQPLNATSAGSVAVASGSLWVMVSTSTAGGCAVDQIDPTTLKVVGQVTMAPAACPLGASPNLAGAGDQLWTSGGSQMLERIDTVQKKVTQTIAATNNLAGGLEASATSVFYSEETGIYRIDSQSSSLVKIEDAGAGVFVDDGMWVQQDAGDVAFTNAYGVYSKNITVTPGQNLVGADENNIYLEDETSKAILQVPIDGSQGSGLGTSNKLGGAGEPVLIVGSHNAYRVYGDSLSPGGPFSLFVENFPLP